MTTMTSTRPTSSALPAIGIGSTVIASGFTVYGAHTWSEIGIVVGAIAVTAGLVFGLVVPRALRRESAGGTSLALSVPAVLLLVPAFWSGVPLVLGVAGLLVGNAGRQARAGAGTCIAGAVLGALAVVGYVAIYILDAMNGGAGFLFD